jgi:nucleoside-diphosphate-sugar epimerase
MTTLVTGAFGCIGAWVVRGLLAGGERPVVFDLADDPWRLRMLVADDGARRVTAVRGDVTDRDALGRVVREHGIRRIVHLAAWQVPLCRQDPVRGASVNVVGTANVFEAARAGRVERVVYASSAAVFGAPGLYPPGPVRDDA